MDLMSLGHGLMSLGHGSHGTSYQKVRPFESLCNSSTNLKEESLDEALDTVELMHQQGIPISRETMFSLLQKCMKKSNLLLARRVHSVITNTGFASVSIFHDHLIRLFAICGSLIEANQVFFNVAKPSAHTWYAIISAYTKSGEGKMALKLFRKMQQMDVRPGMVLFTSVLKACSMIGSFCEGRLLHNQIVEGGVSSDLMIENTLVDMYAKCGSLEDAHKVFDIMVDRDVVSWNALISGYAQHGYGLLPLQLFEKMQGEGTKPCKVTYSSVLKACSNLGIIGNGKIIHKQIVKNRLESDVVIGNALVDMYAKCGILEEAQSVFDGLQNRTVVSWGAIIAGYASQGHGFLALDLFNKMLQDGIKPNRIMLSCILKACSSIAARDHGMSIHDLIIKTELESDVVIGNTVIDMYIRCGSIEDAHKVFTNLLNRDDVSWNAMIAGYSHQGYYLLALELFWKMQQDGIQPCKPLALCVIKACTTLGVLVKGMLLHELLVETGLKADAMIQNTLVDMYAKCGSLKDAQRIFDNLQDRNLVSWGAIISGYAAHRQSLHAFNLFARMQEEGKTPNDVIYLSILRVCISMGDIRQGRFIHDQVIRTGLESALVVGNTLIDMYANCGSLDEGRRVFDALLIRDEVSWGVMLDGYAENKDGFLALELFEKMQEEGVRANRVIFSLILKSCGITGAVEQGRMVHDQIIEFGIELDIETGTTLIDMYGNCGSLLEARRVLGMLPNRDASSWNALIAGYSQHGYAKLALQCLQDMQCQGFKPDGWTFTSILAACSHEGEIEKGYHIFTLMRHGHGITPTMEHFNCIVDILGRVGRLDEAEQLLRTMPKLPDVTGWLALLTACRTFGNNELGRICFHEAVRLDAEKASGYMLMSNICADGHMWEDVLKIQEQRKYASAWKKPGRVWIQVKDKLQQFVVGDKNHLISDTIAAKLNSLKRQLQEVGHMPLLDLVFEPGLHDDAMKK